MANSTPAQPASLSGQVLFYSNPQPLSTEQHAGLGVKQIEKPFAFLGKAHAVPLTVNEFGKNISTNIGTAEQAVPGNVLHFAPARQLPLSFNITKRFKQDVRGER